MKNDFLSALCGFQELVLQKDLQKRPFWGTSGRRIGVLHLSQSATWDLGEHQCLEKLAQEDGNLTNKRGCDQVVITP